jgi:hypothetical protein
VNKWIEYILLLALSAIIIYEADANLGSATHTLVASYV